MMLLLLTIPVGILSDLGLHDKFTLRFPLSITFSLIAQLALLSIFPYDFVRVAKGLILAQLLFIAAYSDAKTHTIPDWIHLLILLDGLILFDPREAMIGFFIISIPLLLIGIFSHGGVGGGDIKLMAACGFALGASGAFFGTVVGMTLFLALHLISYRRENRQKLFAMAPYLAIGCFFAYLFTS